MICARAYRCQYACACITACDRLDKVERVTAALGVDDGTAGRRRLLDARGDLAADVLAHLEFEKEAIGPDSAPVEGVAALSSIIPDPPGTRDLKEYECAQAWSALTSVYRLVSDALSEALASRCGLSMNGFEVMVALAHAEPQPVRLCDLNASVPLSQPALSRLVVRLEAMGLVARVSASRDRRGVLVALTERGRETLRRAIVVHGECISTHFAAHLSDDEPRLLIEALTRVEAAGRADHST